MPLAKLFHVTTDELLGMTAAETDEKKLEYDAVYEKAHKPEQLELAQKTSREYPGEMKYIDWQADCMYMAAYDNYTTQEKFDDDIEKALKLYFVVFENADDDKLKNGSVASIVMALSALKRNDEAVKYAEMYSSTSTLDKDTVMGWALTGDKKTKHLQKVLMGHLDEMLSILINKTDPNNPNLKRLEHLDCAERIINIMFPNGEYNHYLDDLMIIYISRAQILEYSNPEMAVNELKKARTYAKMFDDLFTNAPVTVPYNSPYFDMLSFDSNGFLVYGPLEDNKLIDRFKWWLSGECFAMLRDRSDFMELYSD